MFRKFISAFLLLSSYASHAFLIEGFDVSETWDGAVVYLPGASFPKRIDEVAVEKPLPVIVYLHGCGGINDDERQWANFLKSEGFIVVLPNSFAMKNRVKNCDSNSSVTNLNKFPVTTVRPAEAEYAMKQLTEKQWVDKSNIFLMGHSEGGMAAFTAKEVGFSGVIFTGFKCGAHQAGSAESVPLLGINWEIDPWFQRKDGQIKNCAERSAWRKRGNNKEVLLSGNGHESGREKIARNEVAAFLNKWKK